MDDSPGNNPGAGLPWVPANFLALPEEQSRLETARAVLIPVPYDSTASFRTGARYGPQAVIEASAGLEDYDWELDLDVAELGIHTAPSLEPHVGSPRCMAARVQQAVAHFLKMGKITGVLGGDHSVAIGSAQAHAEACPGLSVLYLDAHADLRHEYTGTQWGHASGARRIHESCSLVLVGLRSMCPEERDFLREHSIPAFFWPPDNAGYVQAVVDSLGPNVYVSVDLDVFDPSLMPAVGTPEPGGMTWQDVMALLGAVAASRRILGFDVSELSPNEGPAACSYVAAKLVYKLIAWSARP